VHRLSSDLDRKITAYREYGLLPLPVGVLEARRLRGLLGALRNARILTCVRDPIARELSASFEENVESGLVDRSESPSRYLWYTGTLEHLKSRIQGPRALEVLSERLNRCETYDYALGWFERELQSVFGVDVYAYPFDRENGYALIEMEDLRVLIVTLEKLDELLPSVLSEFVCPGERLNVRREGVRSNSPSAEAYEYVRSRIRINPEVADHVYSSKLARHFYSPETLSAWRSKWCQGL
jgi:hypothetical protein